MKWHKIWDLILLFFSGSLIGWIWEVLENFIEYGTFSNRGFLHGPWLPIYGTGMVAIYFIKKYLGKNPVILFVVNGIVFGAIEFVSSWILEKCYQIRWWDYSYEFMNLQGRICLKYVVLFAVAGCFAAYLILPWLLSVFRKIPERVKIWSSIILMILMLMDGVISFFQPNTGENVTEQINASSTIAKKSKNMYNKVSEDCELLDRWQQSYINE